MPIDFGQALEIAKTLFAGISAASAAIGTWRSSRNKQKAAAVFDATLAQVRESSVAKEAAEELVAIMPLEVIEDIEARADKCWTYYREVLRGNYLPGQVDAATASVPMCVCAELRRIKELNGEIPERWRGQWNQYRCDDRGSDAIAKESGEERKGTGIGREEPVPA